jgi:hypothetical protein
MTQATLETRVCLCRAYFNSHPTLLLSSIFHSPLPPLYHSRTLPHVDAIAPSYQNVHKHFITRSVLLFFLMDRWHTETCCVFSLSGLDFIPLPSTTCTVALSASTIFSISVCCTAGLLFSMFFSYLCALCTIYLSWTVISYLGTAPNILHHEGLISFSSRVHSRAHITDRPAPRLLLIRGAPLRSWRKPPLVRSAAQPSPSYHGTSRDGSPEPPQAPTLSSGSAKPTPVVSLTSSDIAPIG